MTEPTSNVEYRRFPKRSSVITVYLVTVILTMGGWTTANAGPTDSTEDNLIADIPTTEHQNILYMLLSAELAATRGQEAFALNNYLKAATITQDPAIAEQTTQMAINFQAPTEAAQGAELWAKNAPNNLQAQLIAMTLSIGQSVSKATPYLIRALEINPTQVDQYIAEIQARLSEASAKNLKEALSQIARQRPNDAYAHLTAAQSAAQLGDIKNANRWVDSALTLTPDLTRALELKARLIRYVSDSDTPALQFLSEKVHAFPKNKELRLFYASALIDNGKTDQAKAELNQLTNDKQLGGQALLFLGEILLKENKLQDATNALQKALDYPETRDSAQYLLGETEERQGNIQAAIRWYADLEPGTYQIPGALKAVALLKTLKAYKEAISVIHNSTPNTVEEQKQLILAEIDVLNSSQSSEEAMTLANEVLPKLPDDPDILFSHAMTAAKLKKWEIAENDLKKIIKQNPNNANALNALGYTLSFNKNRLDEALKYIQQALAIAPNNPVFIDSLGWINYQLGNTNEALRYLKKANSMSEDGDIAAHFGEVLWMSDHKEEALAVWKKAMGKDSENNELQETLKRLKVNLQKQ